MRHHRIPSYRLHRASGQGIVTLNGKDHYLGLYDTPESHSKYDQVIADWLKAGTSVKLGRLTVVTDTRVEQQMLTVNEVMLRFLEYAATYYSKEGRFSCNMLHHLLLVV